MRVRLERCFYHDVRNISWNVASLNIFVHDMTDLLYEHWTHKQNKKKLLTRKFYAWKNAMIRGIREMRYLSNNNLVANKETGESLIEIYVTWGCLVAQYNCLDFKNFPRIWCLKVHKFGCQKNSLSLSIPLLLEVLYAEEPDDDFLNFFC